MWRTDSFRKNPDAGKDWRLEEKGTIEDEMVGWHHWLQGHEFEQALAVDDGQGSLGCCSIMGSQRIRHPWAIELDWTDSPIQNKKSKNKTKKAKNRCEISEFHMKFSVI